MIKCPYCKSREVLPCGYDDEAMELWKCSGCQETFARSDLLLYDDDDDDPGADIVDWTSGVNYVGKGDDDDEAMELWKCSNCQETFARSDLLLDDESDVKRDQDGYGEESPYPKRDDMFGHSAGLW